MSFIKATDKPPIVAQIVATNEKGLIGIGNQLPWGFIKEDMEFFKTKTLNHIVIMGYNTVLSLPKKLPKRFMVGVSSRPCVGDGDDMVFHTRCDNIIKHAGTYSGLHTIKDLVADAEADFLNYNYELNPDIVYIAGGGKIYETSLLETDVVFRNVIKCPLLDLEGGEVYYPLERLEKHFSLISSEEIQVENGTMVKEIWVKTK